MYGARISLAVGCAAVLLSMVVGGVPACWRAVGGRVDAVLMRLCDVVLSFPSILIALLIDGLGRALLAAQGGEHDSLAFAVLDPYPSGSGEWAQYAHGARQHPR